MVRGGAVTRSSDIDISPKLDDASPGEEHVQALAAENELVDDFFSASSSEFEFKMDAPDEEDEDIGEMVRKRISE